MIAKLTRQSILPKTRKLLSKPRSTEATLQVDSARREMTIYGNTENGVTTVLVLPLNGREC